jgi:hypothetical protein
VSIDNALDGYGVQRVWDRTGRQHSASPSRATKAPCRTPRRTGRRRRPVMGTPRKVDWRR